jgi:hypothetical protein
MFGGCAWDILGLIIDELMRGLQLRKNRHYFGSSNWLPLIWCRPDQIGQGIQIQRCKKTLQQG